MGHILPHHIWISFFITLQSYNNFVKFVLNNTNFSDDSIIDLNNLTGNLDILLNNYYFKEKDIMVLKEEKSYVYIYNTHDNEKYSDNTTVQDAGIMLSNNLKKLGISSIIEEKKVSDYNNLGLGNYEISRKFIENVKDNRKISFYIDLHRDSVNNTTTIINGKKYAKILFVLGLENANYLENKKVMEKMNNYLNENYKGISKGILEKKGRGVDGIYNQDLDKNIVLIEIGGIENNYDEVFNSTEIISLMLYHMLGDNK